MVEKNKIKTLICSGDSWVFGSEICDPEIVKRYPSNVHIGNYDHIEENDAYRIPKIFPTKLAENFSADCVNLAFPAYDNQSICNTTIEYISKHYINQGKSTDDIFVIVGWSSPERARFWYKDDTVSHKHIMWPSLEWFDNKQQKQFWQLYVAYFWNKEDYIPRFVDTVLRLQNFCNEHNIKYLMFNAFYQGQGSGCSHGYGEDVDIANELASLDADGYCITVNSKRIDGNLYDFTQPWATVDSNRYYCKDQPINSFRSFITENAQVPLAGNHPSEEGHLLWARELYRYILKNKLV